MYVVRGTTKLELEESDASAGAATVRLMQLQINTMIASILNDKI